ncbi:MAG: STAS domain-containing protein [Leptospirales bacterium]|nr:STAS domain-containing protein [Leptospirales bacterium]
MRVHEEADRTIVVIDTDLTIREAGRLRAELAALKLSKPFILDLTEVSEIDSAGLQLIFAFEKDLKEKNLSLQVQPSQSARSVADICGLSWT